MTRRLPTPSFASLASASLTAAIVSFALVASPAAVAQDGAPVAPAAPPAPLAADAAPAPDAPAAPVPSAPAVLTPDDYPELQDDGTWYRSPEYGWVWRPANRTDDWRPYTQGRWDYTEDGWLWVSAEPWGATPFHYGRWTYSPAWGWVWVPGRVWAPAWVVWRYGDGYSGWAPLPPTAVYYPSRGVVWTVQMDSAVGPGAWVFVEDRYVLAPRVYVYVQPPRRNVVYLRVSQPVYVYEVRGGRVVHRGLPISRVERATGQRVTARPLSNAERTRSSQVRGRPTVQHRPAATGNAQRATGSRSDRGASGGQRPTARPERSSRECAPGDRRPECQRGSSPGRTSTPPKARPEDRARPREGRSTGRSGSGRSGRGGRR